MTLIARTTNYRAPTLIADLLMSSKHIERPFILPAIGRDISVFLKDKVSQPSGLAQKTYILNDNVCLALAGDEFEMKLILEELSIFCAIPGVTASQIRQKVDQFDYADFEKSAFFLLVLEKESDGMVSVSEFSHGNFGIGETELFAGTQAGGSGTKDFMNLTGEKVDFSSSFEDNDPIQAIVKSMALIARLLVRERYTIGPLFNHWGGGYEFVYHNGLRFEKMDEVAFVLQYGSFDQNGEVGIEPPVMVLYYKYRGDELTITTFELLEFELVFVEDGSVLRSNKLNITLYHAESLRRGANRLIKDNIESFETYKVAMGFAIVSPTSPLFDPSLFSNTQALKVSYSIDKGSLLIEFNDDLKNYLAKKLESGFQAFSK